MQEERRGRLHPTGQKWSVTVKILSLKIPGTQRKRERWIPGLLLFGIVGSNVDREERPTDMVAGLGLGPSLPTKGECHGLPALRLHVPGGHRGPLPSQATVTALPLFCGCPLQL